VTVVAVSLALLVALGWGLPGPVGAQPKEVVIGLLYPMSGPVAQIGLDAVAAVRTAVDVVNTSTDLAMPLAKTAGLPGLDGAKIRLVVVDHQGRPEVGQAEAERLITQENVHALFGAYHSSVTATTSQVAERLGVPYLNAESSSPGLTERGFSWFFRTSPHDGHFSQVMFDFMRDFEKKRGLAFRRLGILNEDTLFGSDSARVQEGLARQYGYQVVEKIAYRAKTTNLVSEVQRLKAANPDVLLPTSYTSDAILLHRTMKELDYNPRILIAQNAGYTDPSFLASMGKDAEGSITRSPFALDLVKHKPMVHRVNEMFRKHSGGRDLSDVPARAFTGFIVLADAINRAGSTAPEAIRKALAATSIPGDQLIVPWVNVRFDGKGQNTGVKAILMQAQGGQYHTVYPFELATRDVIYPIPKWSERK
jgi:branched-chain amino acid transport system substrate-binding protein